MLSKILLLRPSSRYLLNTKLANNISMRFFASAAQIDDEDSIPENFRDDRTLNFAKNNPTIKNDMLLDEILNKEHNLSSLDSLYSANAKTMSLLQHSFLLYKVNQVYKEIKKRNVPGEDLPERSGLQLENLAQAKHIANNIQKQICFHINRNVKGLDAQALQITINSIS